MNFRGNFSKILGNSTLLPGKKARPERSEVSLSWPLLFTTNVPCPLNPLFVQLYKLKSMPFMLISNFGGKIFPLFFWSLSPFGVEFAFLWHFFRNKVDHPSFVWCYVANPAEMTWGTVKCLVKNGAKICSKFCQNSLEILSKLAWNSVKIPLKFWQNSLEILSKKFHGNSKQSVQHCALYFAFERTVHKLQSCKLSWLERSSHYICTFALEEFGSKNFCRETKRKLN